MSRAILLILKDIFNFLQLHTLWSKPSSPERAVIAIGLISPSAQS